MRLSVWGFSLASAITWALVVFFSAFANLFTEDYAGAFLTFLTSIYPGYTAEKTILQLIIATAYALVDGFVFGLVFSLFYNSFVPKPKES